LSYSSTVFFASQTNATLFGHHLFEIIQKFMANTIFGQTESKGHVHQSELLLIWSMLHPKFHVDTGAHFVCHI